MDWVGLHLPAGARILTTLPELGLDRARYEVLPVDRYDERAALLARSVDLVVTTESRPELRVRADVMPDDANAGPRILLAETDRRRVLRPVTLARESVRVSENGEGVPAMLDGDLASRWESAAPQAPGTFVEIHLPQPRTLAAVELALGDRPRHHAANLHVFALGAGGEWQRLRVVEGRPPVEDQIGEPSQKLLFLRCPRAACASCRWDGACGRGPWRSCGVFEEPAGP